MFIFAAQEGKIYLGLEALGLSTEIIPVHSNVQSTNEILASLLRTVRGFR